MLEGNNCMVKSKQKQSTAANIWSWVKVIAVAVIIAAGVRYFLISPVTVNGHSMDPTLKNGEHLFINKLTKPKRFDIIVFPAPDNSKQEYIKRVIGLPGDKVAYKGDQLYINGKKYSESYLDSEKKELGGGYLTTISNKENFTMKDIPGSNGKTVPKGKLFVLGDNRSISKDSRFIGFISQKKVLGKVIFFKKR